MVCLHELGEWSTAVWSACTVAVESVVRGRLHTTVNLMHGKLRRRLYADVKIARAAGK